MTKILTRDQVDKNDKWDVESVYSSDELWQRDFDKLTLEIDEMLQFRGKITTADKLIQALDCYFDLSRRLDKIYVYTHLKLDEDTSNATYQDFENRATTLYAKFSEKASFLKPEVIKLGKDQIKDWLKTEPELEKYHKILVDLLDEAEHLLSEKEMRLLSSAGSFSGGASTIYATFQNADLKFPKVQNDQGKKEELTASNFIEFMESRQRPVRKQAYQAMYQTLGNYQNTLASTLQNNIQKTTWYARNLKFTSNRAYSLFDARVPELVYDNLIETIHRNLPRLHKYIELRKNILEVDKLYRYDSYVSLSDFDKKYSFDEARDLIIEALKPLGEDYVEIIKKAFGEKWIDKYPNRHKRSGAYSSGCYGSKPFILMNFTDNLNSVFTLAHELGHSAHTYLSCKEQSYHYSDYHIFVAEVASTLNETLLLKYLITRTEDLTEKQALLNHFLDSFQATVFRQTMFAEFELWSHQKIEKGESLTAPILNDFYQSLRCKYDGPAMEKDDLISLEWSRIPHFYSPFYVYQYATGMSTAIALAEQILTEGESATARYKDFLRSGSSKHPLELLKLAGVDMASPEPIQSALDQFSETIEELRKTL